MMKFPTIREFIEKTTAGYGATLRTTTSPVTGPRGPVTFRYLEREVEGTVLRTTPLPDDDEMRLSPHVYGSFVRQLKLPHDDFGYSLGFVGEHLDEEADDATTN